MYSCNLLDERTKKEYSKEIDSIIADADSMLSGYYKFDSDWDMEPCLDLLCNDRIRWDIEYNGDREWTFMFTRMDYLYKLIFAYEVTGETKYLLHGIKIIKKWQKDNIRNIVPGDRKIFHTRLKSPNYGYRTLDVSIQTVNAAQFSLYCMERNVIDAKQYNRIRDSVDKCIKYVLDSDDDYRWFSNWGIIENGSILLSSELLGLDHYSGYAYDRLLRQILNQILPDGSQIESSPMYLVQILLVLCRYVLLGKNHEKTDILKALRASFDYLYDTCMPDNHMPNLGDSDLTDISDIMYMAYSIFDDKKYLNKITRKLSLEQIYRLDGRLRINEHKTKKIDSLYNPSFKDAFITLSYQTVLREKENGIYLSCNNIPRIVSGHKHYDYLSFILYLYSYPVFIDMGRYSYVDGEDRKFYIGPEAHNTVRINGEQYYQYASSWVIKQSIRNNRVASFSNDKLISTRMSMTFGYNEMSVCRYITYICNIGFIITDVINSNEGVQYEAFFNLDNAIETKDSALVLPNGCTVLFGCSSESLSRTEGTAELSPRYNEKTPSKHICFKGNDINGVVSYYLLINEHHKCKVEFGEDQIDYIISDDKENIDSYRIFTSEYSDSSMIGLH